MALIRDVFAAPSLLADRPRIERRMVAWGGAPLGVAHRAIVVSEATLIEALPVPACPERAASADFIVQAVPSPAQRPRRFGSRRALAAEVRLKSATAAASCWIEALPAGWLFLVCGEAAAAWLLAVGDEIEDLLARSRLIAPLIDEVLGASATRCAPHGAAAADSPCRSIDASPRIAEELAGEDWLLCGTAAIAFDPICGDGVAQAVREAILASAVIIARLEGGDAASLRSHYEAMLTASMRRHLRLCADFYRTGGDGPWWDEQLRSLAAGYEWCSMRLASAAEPRYRLSGLRLVARGG